MVYREPGQKVKETLYLVHFIYVREGRNSSIHSWVRAKDSFKALQTLLTAHDVKDHEVWAQYVYSMNDFQEKDLEVE